MQFDQQIAEFSVGVENWDHGKGESEMEKCERGTHKTQRVRVRQSYSQLLVWFEELVRSWCRVGYSIQNQFDN